MRSFSVIRNGLSARNVRKLGKQLFNCNYNVRAFIWNMLIFNLFDKQILFDIIVIFIWFLEYWFILQQGTML